MKTIKNLSWIFFANVFASFAKWLIVILIAKNLTATEVGIYSLAFAIGAPVTLFANMKLRSLYITSIEDNLYDYFYTRNILSVAVFITLAIIGLVFYPDYFTVIMLVGLAKILDLQSDLYYAVPHKYNNLNIIGKMIISKQSILLVSFAITLLLTRNLSAALLVQVVLQAIYLILVERKYVFKNYQITKAKATLQGIKGILILGVPLGFVQMVFSLNSNYPRYVLEYFENPEVLGYFSAIMYIVIVANLFMSSISQVFLPKLSQLYRALKFSLFRKYVFIYLSMVSLFLGISLISMSFLFGEKILMILYGPEYAEYSHILFLVAISVSINVISWNFDTALMAMRYISIQPKITSINLIITMIIGYVLISEQGIVGASYTLIISATLQLLMRVYFVHKRLNSKEI